MKIAIISDVHANPKALQTALDDARDQGCERIICLGDIVGYGYDPNTCIDICRNENMECVLGNHDAGIIGKLGLGWFSSWAQGGVMRHRKEVDEPRKEWLRSLEYQKQEKFGAWRCCFSHGTYSCPEKFGYIQGPRDANLEVEFMKMRGCDILFVGHTHFAEAFSRNLDGDFFWHSTINAAVLSINPNNYAQLIVNVGSIGYPRNQPHTVYVIFDTDEQSIYYRQLPFDYLSYEREMVKRNVGLTMWMKAKVEEAKKGNVSMSATQP